MDLIEMGGGGADEAAGEVPGIHPLALLSKQLWLAISDKLQNSSDITNLASAIPEIKLDLEGTKQAWLFDKILPLLSTYLTAAELLLSRQVCRRWTLGVDAWLAKLWDPENDRIRYLKFRSCRQFDWCPFQTMHFSFPKEVNEFLKNWGDPSLWRSPIISREVDINTIDVKVLTGASKLFQRVGSHIWFLTLINWRGEDGEAHFRSLREWLDLLPNLKSLSLWLPFEIVPDDEEEAVQVAEEVIIPEYQQPWREPLPPLPNFEGLDIQGENVPSFLVNALISTYSHQIRSLSLPLRFWKPELYSAFPNLSHLNFGMNPNRSKERAIQILLSIQAPLLTNLELYFEESSPIQMGTDIFPWLRRFPLIEDLRISYEYVEIIGGPDIFTPADSIPSIRYLSLEKDFLHGNSNFLLCFPNLECLYLDYNHQIPEGPPLEPTVRLWEPMVNLRMYESNVWELLPELENITVTDDDNILPEVRTGLRTRFNRPTFQYLKKMADQQANN